MGKFLRNTILAGMMTKDVINSLYNAGKTLKKDLSHDNNGDGCESHVSTRTGKGSILANSSQSLFSSICGYEKLKTIFYRAIESDKPVHILLIGPPAIGKTMFLTEIEKRFPKETEFVIGDKTSGSGLLDKLFEKKPKYLCIDEIGLLDNEGQTSILNMMETGKVIETFKTRARDMELHSWVFATSNDGDLIEPLKSRFMCLYLKEYSYEQFSEIAKKMLQGLDPQLIDVMCHAVWFKQNSKDPRDVVKLSRLCKTIEEVNETVDTAMEYGEK